MGAIANTGKSTRGKSATTAIGRASDTQSTTIRTATASTLLASEPTPNGLTQKNRKQSSRAAVIPRNRRCINYQAIGPQNTKDSYWLLCGRYFIFPLT